MIQIAIVINNLIKTDTRLKFFTDVPYFFLAL